MSTEVTPEVGSVTLGPPPVVNNLHFEQVLRYFFHFSGNDNIDTDQQTVPGKA